MADEAPEMPHEDTMAVIELKCIRLVQQQELLPEHRWQMFALAQLDNMLTFDFGDVGEDLHNRIVTWDSWDSWVMECIAYEAQAKEQLAKSMKVAVGMGQMHPTVQTRLLMHPRAASPHEALAGVQPACA